MNGENTTERLDDINNTENTQKNNIENKLKKQKIVPSYNKKDEPINIKTKSKKNRISKITIIFLILCLLVIGAIVFGVISFINYNKYKPYRAYEEKMKTYGFDKAYNNESVKTGESITKSEAIKMILAACFNTNDISGFAAEPEGENNYENAMWVEYAKYRGIITDGDINKDNYKSKASYIEVIRYLATAKTKLLEKELDSAVQLKVKDIDKYKSDEQVAIEDMIQNEIIKVNTKKIKGNKHIFKGQMNELISNFVEKYNTITVNGEKININEDKKPSNKDEYPYTLANVEKNVYEKKFSVDDENNFINPKELYSTKKEYYTQIQQIAEGYYNLILNVDYNTINYDDLKDEMLPYMLYGADGLEEYVKYVKDNKIKIEGKSTVIFPVVYFDGLQYAVRMKLEFEVKNSETKNNLLYMDPIDDTENPVKYDNDKYTLYIDAKMGSALTGSTALYNDNTSIYDLLLEDQKDVMMKE